MKKLTTLLLLIMFTVSLYSQEKVILSHAIKMYDMVEISLELENKPNDRFHLIKIDTLATTNYNGQVLHNNFLKMFSEGLMFWRDTKSMKIKNTKTWVLKVL